MIVIRCAACKRKILKYRKIGKGRVLKCYKDRVSRWYVPLKDGTLVCPCGCIIGTDAGTWIKMRQNTFEYSGTVVKK